jgi:hypothetical protein
MNRDPFSIPCKISHTYTILCSLMKVRNALVLKAAGQGVQVTGEDWKVQVWLIQVSGHHDG